MRRFVAQLSACALVLATACARQLPSSSHAIDERSPRWAEWAGRIDALPVCLPLEWDAARREAPSFVAGDTVQVRGQLALLELDCSAMIRELVLRGLWLPEASTLYSLRELDDAVARAERVTCGSMLGLRVGLVEFAFEPPLAAQPPQCTQLKAARAPSAG